MAGDGKKKEKRGKMVVHVEVVERERRRDLVRKLGKFELGFLWRDGDGRLVVAQGSDWHGETIISGGPKH
uniref:Uncharacterized protein n=1 Tax=Cannabis sativa TaxID=3483 RepID=A0A803PNC1_CANSA